MRKADREARAAIGACLGSERCDRPRRPTSTLCQHHHEQHTRAVREYRRRRTASGLCPVAGCKDPPREDAVYCRRHSDEHNAKSLAWHNEHRERARASERRWQAARKAAGLCRLCPKPLHSKTLCRECLADHNARNRARKQAAGAKPTTKRCRLCRELGCRRDVCPLNTSRLVPMPLEELQARPDRKAIAAHWSTT